MWVIGIQIYLICIFVVKSSWPSKDSKITGMRGRWDFPLFFRMGWISARTIKGVNVSKLNFYLWWSGVQIPRMAMMAWNYSWSMDMWFWVRLSKIMPTWRIASLITIFQMDLFSKEKISGQCNVYRAPVIKWAIFRGNLEHKYACVSRLWYLWFRDDNFVLYNPVLCMHQLLAVAHWHKYFNDHTATTTRRFNEIRMESSLWPKYEPTDILAPYFIAARYTTM